MECAKAGLLKLFVSLTIFQEVSQVSRFIRMWSEGANQIFTNNKLLTFILNKFLCIHVTLSLIKDEIFLYWLGEYS